MNIESNNCWPPAACADKRAVCGRRCRGKRGSVMPCVRAGRFEALYCTIIVHLTDVKNVEMKTSGVKNLNKWSN